MTYQDYIENEVYSIIENVEDLSQDKRILNATENEIKEMAKRIAKLILNDNQVCSVINEAIEFYIYHDEFMLTGETK